jgi:hypothetical protein
MRVNKNGGIIKGFAFLEGHADFKEEQTIAFISNYWKIPRASFPSGRQARHFHPDWMPVGPVAFVEEFIGKSFVPNYLPNWLSNITTRRASIHNYQLPRPKGT